MGLSAATGVLALRTTDGDDTIALVDQLGAGFAGKALWLWATLCTAQDTTTPDAIQAQGISDGTTHYSTCGAVQDNQTTSNANRYHAAKALVLIDNTGAKLVDCTAAFSGNN